MMSSHVDKSYRLGHFRDNEGSLERLKRQGGAVLNLEFEHLREAGLQLGVRVMDMGCGPGIIASEMFMRTSPSHFVAVDCNEISLAETRMQFASRGLVGADVRHGNIYDVTNDTRQCFDFIYSRLVFQHLSEPLTALLNVQNQLAPGGRFCVCDIDDRWLSVSPQPTELSPFLRRVASSQARRGGDREVGTKLPDYFSRTGFINIRSSSLLLSTDLVGKEQFCDLVLGYKLETVPESELFVAQNEVSAIKKSIMSPHGWGAVAIFFVSGETPQGV